MLARVPHHLAGRWIAAFGMPPLCALFVLAALDVAGQAFLWENAHWGLSSALAATFLVLRIRRDHRVHVRLLAAGVLMYFAAQMLYLAQLAIRTYTVPAPSDLVFLASGIPIIAGVLWLPGRSMTGAERKAMVLDVAVLIALIFTAVIGVYAPLATGAEPLAGATLLAYPVVFLGAAAAAAVAGLVQGSRPNAGGGTLLLIGLATLGLSWVVWLAEAMTAYPAPGSLVNIAASIGIVLVGLGVFTWDDAGPPDPSVARVSGILLGLIPLVAIVLGVGVLASLELLLFEHPEDPTANWLLHAAAASTCLLAVVRQTLLLWDRSRLLVSERTARAEAAAALESHRVIDRRFRASTEVLDQLRDRLLLAESDTDIVSAAAAVVLRLVPAPRGDILLTDPHSDGLVVADAWGPESGLPIGALVARDGRPVRCTGIRRGAVHVEPDTDAHGALRCPARPSATGTTACIPILTASAALGVIHLERDANAGFSAVEMSHASTIAAQVGLALANRSLLTRMKAEALTDALTGAYNGRYFDRFLDRTLATAAREEQPVGIIMADIDHFKRINDTHGHAGGDDALKTFVRVVDGALRPSDTLARYGGEEFVIAVRGGDSPTTRAIAERVRTAVESHVFRLGDGAFVPITASFGCASSDVHGLDRAALLRAADQGLYAAKRRGRNRVVSVAGPR